MGILWKAAQLVVGCAEIVSPASVPSGRQRDPGECAESTAWHYSAENRVDNVKQSRLLPATGLGDEGRAQRQSRGADWLLRMGKEVIP